MQVPARITLLVAALALPRAARADHHGMVMGQPEDTPSTFGAGISLLAATFATTYYAGDYEGVMPSASWVMGRYSAGANLPFYRLYENGLPVYGLGDFVVHGQAALLVGHTTQAGLLAAVSAPTGNDVNGLGMGHWMLMPALWGAWRIERLVLTGSFGYSRAVVHASAQHDHGMWPLVEPMNMSELTWSGAGEVALGEGVRAGARLSGGVPVGILPGHDRMVGAARIAWGTHRIDTSAELQAGLVGDPFTIRAVIATAVQF